MGYWYQNIQINELEGHINKVSNLGNFVLGLYISVDNGSPSYGQLIDSKLSEDGYSVYFNAEIVSAASRAICNSVAPGYMQYAYNK